jgi:hypothetical protein
MTFNKKLNCEIARVGREGRYRDMSKNFPFVSKIK